MTKKEVEALVKTVPVRFGWTNCKPDPLAYKPYSPEFAPRGVIVEVQVPEELVIAQEEDLVVLSPGGMANCLMQLAIAIRKIQNGDD